MPLSSGLTAVFTDALYNASLYGSKWKSCNVLNSIAFNGQALNLTNNGGFALIGIDAVDSTGAYRSDVNPFVDTTYTTATLSGDGKSLTVQIIYEAFATFTAVYTVMSDRISVQITTVNTSTDLTLLTISLKLLGITAGGFIIRNLVPATIPITAPFEMLFVKDDPTLVKKFGVYSNQLIVSDFPPDENNSAYPQNGGLLTWPPPYTTGSNFVPNYGPIYNPISQVDGSIGPGQSSTFTFSLRVGPVGATPLQLAPEFYTGYAAAFPYTVNWPDRRPIGQGFTQDWAGRLSGLTGQAYQDELLTIARECAAGLQAVNAQGFFIHDAEGYPFGAAQYVGDIAQTYISNPPMGYIAPGQSLTTLQLFFKVFSDNGFLTGCTVRGQATDVTADSIIELQSADFNGVYTPGSQLPPDLQLLFDRISFAVTNFNLSIFYIDSAGFALNQPHPSHWAAFCNLVYTTFPHVLLCPEQATLAAYANCMPYTEVRSGGFGVLSGDPLKAAYPSSGALVWVEDTVDPLSNYSSQLQASMEAGNILLLKPELVASVQTVAPISTAIYGVLMATRYIVTGPSTLGQGQSSTYTVSSVGGPPTTDDVIDFVQTVDLSTNPTSITMTTSGEPVSFTTTTGGSSTIGSVHPIVASGVNGSPSASSGLAVSSLSVTVGTAGGLGETVWTTQDRATILDAVDRMSSSSLYLLLKLTGLTPATRTAALAKIQTANTNLGIGSDGAVWTQADRQSLMDSIQNTDRILFFAQLAKMGFSSTYQDAADLAAVLG